MILEAGTTLLTPPPVDVDPMSEAWPLEHITAMRGQAWKPGTAEHKDVQREVCRVRVSPVIARSNLPDTAFAARKWSV